VVCAFPAHPNWSSVLHATLVPRMESASGYAIMLLALAGTTISPYLFFWGASQEVEEDREKGRITLAARKGATRKEIDDSRVDVTCGMLFSNLIMYFIILTTAATLHTHGGVQIATTEQAAAALKPLAGRAAYLLFTLGIVGSGMLSVPVLAGSAAFAIAEGAGWRNSLGYHPRQAPAFYGVLFVGLIIGASLNYFGVAVISMLYWSAVINGFLAPPLLVLVVLLSADRKVMGKHACSGVLRTLGWVAAAVQTLASAGALIAP
jgi:Mn2+/Fe2+ NRAMP family transporter